MFYVMVLIILLDGCSISTSEAEFIKKAEVFHNNFNNDRHDINYEILKKNSGMSASKDDYVKTFSFVKSRLGNLKSVKLLNVNFSQTTFAGEKLVRVSFDSYFDLGVAKEFFYFSEPGDLYRHEIYSKNLLDNEI